MNYHNITYPDINNGDGLRVVLWLSGCSHHCKGCQNEQIWDAKSGIEFDSCAAKEILRELDKDYISGLTLSGGNPLYHRNLHSLYLFLSTVKEMYPTKTIWMYTGFTFEEIFPPTKIFRAEDVDELYRMAIVGMCDVIVDGRYMENLRDASLPYRASSNQRVIDVRKSMNEGYIVVREYD